MVGGWGTPLGSLWVSSIPGVGIVGDIHMEESGRVRADTMWTRPASLA